MGETNNFPGLKNETETETFNFGLMEPRPRPRLSFWVSWNRDRDRDFNMKSRETETFTRPDILSLGGTETGTETTKVSVPRVSAPRPPISDLEFKLYVKRAEMELFLEWIQDFLPEVSLSSGKKNIKLFLPDVDTGVQEWNLN